MPSTPLTDAIVALTTYANTVTGESDATLSAAVESLVDGFGGGASLEFIKTVTLDSAVNELQLQVGDLLSDYNMIVIEGSMTFSAVDWFYPNYWVGASKKVMSGYSEKVSSYDGIWMLVMLPDQKVVISNTGKVAFFVTDAVTALGGHLYAGTSTIAAGTSFNYYGVKYSLS